MYSRAVGKPRMRAPHLPGGGAGGERVGIGGGAGVHEGGALFGEVEVGVRGENGIGQG